MAELFAKAQVEADYAGLTEERRIALLLGELAKPRLLYSPYLEYADETNSELNILHTAREIRRRYGDRAIRNYIISHTENHLQVELIKRHRATVAAKRTPEERVQRGIHLTINGVAAGLRNTG